MPHQLKISGDPRRPAEVRKFTRDKQPPVDESASELYLMAALLFGMAALLLRVKLAAWAALILVLSSFANSRRGQDMKQFVSGVVFAVFGMASCYIVPPASQRAAAAAMQASGAAAGGAAT